MMSKANLLKVHRWVGLCLSLLLLVQGLTGTILVFRDEIDRLIHAELIVDTPSGMARLPVQSLVDKVRAEVPGATLQRIEFPGRPDGALIFIMRDQAREPYIVAVDPYRGTILRQGGYGAWPTELVFRIHDGLLSGDVGDMIIGCEGVGLAFIIIVGFASWWPGRRRLRQGFRVIRGQGTDRTVRTFHRALGGAAAAILLMSATTGALMIFRADLQPMLAMTKRPAPKVAERPGHARLPADTLIERATATHGPMEIDQIRFSGKELQVVALYFKDEGAWRANATRQFFVNAYDGREMGRYDPRDLPAVNTAFDWMFTIHTGRAAWMPGRLLVLAGGLSLIFFTISGVWLWSSRTRARKAKVAARKAAASLVPQD
nr:PepSY-associated TM helix domain-containing protein [Sphingomonas sp. Y57]